MRPQEEDLKLDPEINWKSMKRLRNRRDMRAAWGLSEWSYCRCFGLTVIWQWHLGLGNCHNCHDHDIFVWFDCAFVFFVVSLQSAQFLPVLLWSSPDCLSLHSSPTSTWLAQLWKHCFLPIRPFLSSCFFTSWGLIYKHCVCTKEWVHHFLSKLWN